MAPAKHWRIANIVMTVLFLAAIWLPLCDSLFGIDPSTVQAENRDETIMPEFSWTKASIESFPEKFEAFYNDNFGFRKTLITWHGLAKMKLLRSFYSSRVIIGKDGWLFFRGDRTIENYRCIDPFSEEQLDRWVRLFDARRRWLESQGIRYIIVFAPNKHTIYPEYLPEGINKVRNESRLDQLVKRFEEIPGIEFVDMREKFLDAKKEGRLYHKTDTHWNGVGRYLTCKELVSRLSSWFPRISFPSPDAYDATNELCEGGDLTRLLGIKEQLKERRPDFKPKDPKSREADPGELLTSHEWPPLMDPLAFEVDDENLPRAMFVGDSFGIGLHPLMAEFFRRSTFIWHIFSRTYIEDERPDVVINQLCERYLMYDLPEDVDELEDLYVVKRKKD